MFRCVAIKKVTEIETENEMVVIVVEKKMKIWTKKMKRVWRNGHRGDI